MRIFAALAVALLLAACASVERTTHEGQVVNGQTTVRYPNGETYVGQMQDGLRSGRGSYSWPDGRKYTGSFERGFPNGQGVYTFANGEKYQGDFVDNRRTGQGTYSWPDGRKYVGAFRDDVPNGQGTYTWADGRRQVGEFQNGQFVDDRTTMVAVSLETRAQVAGEAPLQRRGVNYIVRGLVNDTETVEFYLDSGSADVALPSYIVDALRRSGSIRSEDDLGRASYAMANGQARTAVTFRIRSLRIGPVVVENVRGSVLDYAGPPLLGMSFLGRFKQWSVDNDRQVLVLH